MHPLERARLLGINAIPIPAAAKGPAGTGIRFSGRNRRGSDPYTAREHAAMVRQLVRRGYAPDGIGAYLLVATAGLVVVDVDDPDAPLGVFPHTPYQVTRSGRTRHYWYRCPPGVDPKKMHLIGAYGRRSVDIIATTGVVAPGSIHEDGETYTIRPDWPASIEDLPILPLEIVQQLRAARAPAPAPSERPTPKGPEGGGPGTWHHFDLPRETSNGNFFAGYVDPTAKVRIAATGAWVEIQHAPSGTTRCYASYRDDDHPSAAVVDHKGARMFWDYSRACFWVMLSRDSTEDTTPLPWRVEEYLGIPHEILPTTDKWITIPPIEDDTTVFLVAPHGTGKTVFARSEHERALTSVSVTNTRALTNANAEVLGLQAVHDKPAPKGSVCIPSLTRYTTPPEFFHVDEADAVHGYLHSGNVEGAQKVLDRLMTFCAESTRCLIASADLTFDDIKLYTESIRDRAPERKFRLYFRGPSTDLSIEILPLGTVKAELDAAIGRERVYLACSSRRLPGAVAQGYRAASKAPSTIALDADLLDLPEPPPLPDAPKAGAPEAWTVSGDNSRYHRTAADLRHPDEIIRTHQLVTVSPAVQSGVSFIEPVDRVFALHTNRSLPGAALIQMIRRIRYPKIKTIKIGVPAWRPNRADMPDLMAIAERRIRLARSYWRALPRPPETDPSPELIDSWIVTARKQIRAHQDPIGDLVREAKRHGFRVTVALGDAEDPEEFNARARAGKDYRREVNAHDVASARDIDADERDAIQRSARLADGDRAAAEKYDLRRFYEREVTPALVLLDNNGRFRAQCRAYAHVCLIEAGETDALTLLDAKDGRAPMIARHASAKAAMLAKLWRAVARKKPGVNVTLQTSTIRTRVLAWRGLGSWRTMYPTDPGPKPKTAVDWWRAKCCAAMGAQCSTVGHAGTAYAVDWARVDEYADPYARRLLAAAERRQREPGASILDRSGRVDVDRIMEDLRKNA